MKLFIVKEVVGVLQRANPKKANGPKGSWSLAPCRHKILGFSHFFVLLAVAITIRGQKYNFGFNGILI